MTTPRVAAIGTIRSVDLVAANALPTSSMPRSFATGWPCYAWAPQATLSPATDSWASWPLA